MRTPAPALSIEHALLGFVAQHPAHGYDIYQQLASCSGLWQVWRLKQSQLYALLAKLEDAGYLAATVQVQEARPPRKMYDLTAKGRLALEEWLATPVGRGRQMRTEFLAKLYFVQRQDSAATLRLIDAQTAACEQWLAELYGATNSPEADFYVCAVQQFRVTQVESFLTWLTTCRALLLVPDTHRQ